MDCALPFRENGLHLQVMPTSIARKPAAVRRAPVRSTKSERVSGSSRGDTPRLLHGRVHTRLKGCLTCVGHCVMGPRYIRLLEAVGVAGTIRGACEQCDMS